MRTDPRADEVRKIVEEVFSGYFRGPREPYRGSRPLNSWGCGGRQAGRLHHAAVFPRLYEPQFCDPADEDIDPAWREIDETILIDQGRYVERSYRTEGYMAMWLVEVGIVQFYDDLGQMLATINLFELLRPQRMAA